MRLTTKGRFAVTAMLDVALHELDGPVTLAGIADRQHISLSYLEQLFGKLRRQSLVESVRGPGGGYQLARAAHSLNVAEIIAAVEEPIDSTQCAGKENCLGDSRCMTHALWEGLNRTVYDFLANVSLGQLVAAHRATLPNQQHPQPIQLSAPLAAQLLRQNNAALATAGSTHINV